MQRARHISEHMSVNLSRFRPCTNLCLESCNQLGGVGVAAVGSVSDMLEQCLQQKEIAKGKGLFLTFGRHVASGAVEGGKDFVRRFFQVVIEIGRERGRPALGDRGRDLPRMLTDLF
ncbi:hypothetical protein [Bradyrhizobium cenepequi]